VEKQFQNLPSLLSHSATAFQLLLQAYRKPGKQPLLGDYGVFHSEICSALSELMWNCFKAKIAISAFLI
jgi:hypothetical protein